MRKALLLAAAALLCLAGLSFAEFAIPQDQPICRLYGLIQTFATIGGIIAGLVAAFTLITSHDLSERGNAKLSLGWIIIGLIIVWLVPLVVKYLVDAGDVCGW